MPEALLLIRIPNPAPFQSCLSTLVAQAKSHTSYITLNLSLPSITVSYKPASPIDGISQIHPQPMYYSPPPLHSP